MRRRPVCLLNPPTPGPLPATRWQFQAGRFQHEVMNGEPAGPANDAPKRSFGVDAFEIPDDFDMPLTDEDLSDWE